MRSLAVEEDTSTRLLGCSSREGRLGQTEENVNRRALIATMVVAGLATWVGAAAPSIAVDSDVYEFGSVLEGSFVVHRFAITNIGDAPLASLSVYSTCGCTTSALPSTTLEPGATVDVEIVSDTAGYGGMSVT